MKKLFVVGLICFFAVGCVGFVSLKEPRAIVRLKDTGKDYEYLSCCVVPFESDKLSSDWKKRIGLYYRKALASKEVFSEVKFLDVVWRSDDDLLYYGASSECGLILKGRVVKMLATGGGTTQRILLETDVLDVSSGKVIFSVVQEGFSYPGMDLDFFWHSFVGSSSPSVENILERLAFQFATLFFQELKKSQGCGF